ncbi:hypothetical protein ColTof3_12990 [Colletotrichum tofieldiae]|nr:hypothetical protein ColTof3_12990 [Colletotrichum tofieldiae]
MLPPPPILNNPTDPPVSQQLVLPQQAYILDPAIRQDLGAQFQIIRLNDHFPDASRPAAFPLSKDSLARRAVRAPVLRAFSLDPEPGLVEF